MIRGLEGDVLRGETFSSTTVGPATATQDRVAFGAGVDVRASATIDARASASVSFAVLRPLFGG